MLELTRATAGFNLDQEGAAAACAGSLAPVREGHQGGAPAAQDGNGPGRPIGYLAWPTRARLMGHEGWPQIILVAIEAGTC